jgi:hypothetical protein
LNSTPTFARRNRPEKRHDGAVEILLREDYYRGWVEASSLFIHDDAHVSIQKEHDDLFAIVDDATGGVVDAKEAVGWVLREVSRARDDGTAYAWGGTMGPCFDCSGLTQGAFRDAGTWIPRDAYQQRAFATPVTDVRDAMPGDLLFFGDSDAVEDVGAFYTLVPIRPRSRGERRSLRTLPGVSLRTSLAVSLSIPTRRSPRAFELQRTHPTRTPRPDADHVAMLVDDVELDAVTPADATRATLRYAHSSCASTGRDGVSRDALVVTLLPPGQGQGPGGGDGRGWTEPRAHESGDAVQARYAGRFASVGRITRRVRDPSDVVYRDGRKVE